MSTKKNGSDDMRPEYDFSKGVRGKYAKMFPPEVRLIPLDPDLSPHFPDTEAVNKALRFLVSSFSPQFLAQVLKQPVGKKSKKAS